MGDTQARCSGAVPAQADQHPPVPRGPRAAVAAAAAHGSVRLDHKASKEAEPEDTGGGMRR